MTEDDARDIVAMIEGHWYRQVTNVTKDMYVRFLKKHDAELVVAAVAKLAETNSKFPQISDIRDMLGTVTGRPALEPGICPTCHDDKIVLVQTRPAEASLWMMEKGLEVNPSSGYDETAPCPDCNAGAITDYRVIGHRYRPLDEATVRERMEPVGGEFSPRTKEVPLWVRRWHYARHVVSPPDMRRFAEQGVHGDRSEELMPDDAYLAEALRMQPDEVTAFVEMQGIE